MAYNENPITSNTYDRSHDLFPMQSVPYPTEEQMQARRNWVASLRAGKHSQYQKALRNAKGNKRCCLGMACLPQVSGVRLKLATGLEGDVGYIEPEDNRIQFYVLPQEVMEALGLTEKSPSVFWEGAIHPRGVAPLAMMNDEGVTFEEIADCIEATYITPFEETP